MDLLGADVVGYNCVVKRLKRVNKKGAFPSFNLKKNLCQRLAVGRVESTGKQRLTWRLSRD